MKNPIDNANRQKEERRTKDYLYVLSFYDKALGDSRFKEMIDILLKKLTATGIVVENPHKKWKDILYNEKPECNLANSKYSEIKENLRDI